MIGGASPSKERRIKSILDLFLEALVTLLNNIKRIIYGWNTPPITLRRISQIFEIHYKTEWTPFKYLGMPLFKQPVKSKVWTKILNKMRKEMKN